MNAAVRDLQTLFEVGPLGGLSDGQLLDRFVARREGAVFEAITHRHGPMVWGVCRRVLRDHHDAEDAFQATFLVFARKASSVMTREKLGNWLYGVAYQTAMKARATRAKRRVRESQVSDMPEPMVVPHDLRDALAESLDRELSRLPEKYRIPIVLCDLEGRTHKEAASQLGWPIGTVSGRLSRAKSMLAKRLARRGISLSVGTLAMLLAQDTASASVPTRLIGSTAQAASLIAAGQAATGVVSAEAVTLTVEVLKAMLISKLKIVVMVLLGCFVLAAGGTGLAYRAQATEPKGQEEVLRRPINEQKGEDRPSWKEDLQRLIDERIFQKLLQQLIDLKSEDIQRLTDEQKREDRPIRKEALQRRIDEKIEDLGGLVERLHDVKEEDRQRRIDRQKIEDRRTEGQDQRSGGQQRLEQRIDAIEKKLDRILRELESMKGQPPGSGRRAGDN